MKAHRPTDSFSERFNMNLFQVNRRQVCLLGLAALAAGRVSAQAAAGGDALHVLNRLAYGPAPGDRTA